MLLNSLWITWTNPLWNWCVVPFTKAFGLFEHQTGGLPWDLGFFRLPSQVRRTQILHWKAGQKPLGPTYYWVCTPLQSILSPNQAQTLSTLVAEFLPNSMIDCDNVASTCMDGIKSLGTSLCAFHNVEGHEAQLIMWKSDIQMAYWNMWVSPEWQTKQIVTIGDKRYVNWCNCFDNHSLYKVFLSFSSLLAWIAEHVTGISHLKVYIDNNCSFQLDGDIDIVYYPPHQCYFLSNQMKLLLLWDEPNVPHKQKKTNLWACGLFCWVWCWS